MTDSTMLPSSEVAPSTSGNKPGGKRAARPVPQPPPIPLEMLGGGDGQNPEQNEEDLERALLRAPPWLVSTVLHMFVLIFLGVRFIASEQKAEVEIVATPGEEDSLDNAEMQLQSPDPVDQTAFSPIDLPKIVNPIAPPTLSELSPNASLAGANVTSTKIGLGLSGREKGMKRALGRKFGITIDVKEAIKRALEWFKRNQRADGSWSLKGPYADGSFEEDFPAATGMALLAFQGDGHTHKSGDYKGNVRRGWEALLKMQSADGQFLGTGLSVQHQLYAHAQCTIAVCEIYGMTQDPAFRKPAEQAIEYCFKSQDKEGGGWRYQPGIDSDLSVTGWFLMALHTARMAGIEVPDEVLARASGFLDKVQTGNGSQYAYLPGGGSTLAMTAEGLLSRQYLGWRREDPRLVAGANYVVSNPIKMSDNERDVYYWYYATQMLHHMEGQYWRQWNKVMCVEVPRAQIKNGQESGSWDPGVYKYGEEGGRLFVTALQTYMLESYYRHMPLYTDK